MGFGRYLLGGLAAVGSIIAAPVVLPVVAGAAATAGTALAGTAVGSAAVAAGTAAAGTVAAAGTAVAGTAAAAGTALAGTAVGNAVVSTMGMVGTAVGSAAGAAGLTSIATVTVTEAGAAAVGTIATSTAIGAGTTISGGRKMHEAREITEEAERLYKQERAKFDTVEQSANKILEKLGEEKILVWESFGKFLDAYKRINNKGYLSGNLEKERLGKVEIVDLQDATILAISAKDFLKSGVITATSSQLIGLASSAGFTSLATASTGAAISGLHGVAASNAALAALGGGAKTVGGLGMAGGAAVSQALTFAPAIAIGGIMLNSKGNKALKDAESIKKESDEIIEKLHEAIKELKELNVLVAGMVKTLKQAREKFELEIQWLEKLVEHNTNAILYTDYEKKRITSMAYQLKILKHYSMIQLIKDDKYYIEQSKKEKEELEAELIYK